MSDFVLRFFLLLDITQFWHTKFEIPYMTSQILFFSCFFVGFAVMHSMEDDN